MRLFELDIGVGIGAKLVAVTDQLKTDLENNKLNFGIIV